MWDRVVVCLLATVAFAGVVWTSTEVDGAVVWNEAVHGDISGARLSPTAVVLGIGTNSLIGSIQSGDLDYITVKVLPGQQFTKFVLQDYVGIDFTSFIAVQAGATFTAAPPAPPVASLLGYSHFGPNAPFGARVGDDLMYSLGTASGAIGFAAPLLSGDYTFWLQQTGSHTEYQFDFVVVPEPASILAALCGTALVAAVFDLRRRSA
jgi:hypothetical protein